MDYPIKDKTIYDALRERRKRRSMLDDWYGAKYASVEIAAHRPKPRPIGELVSALLDRLPGADVAASAKLFDLWREAAGPQAAAVSGFRSFSGDTMTVAVVHNVWLRELAGLEQVFLERLAALWPESPVRHIKFVPGSIRPR